MLDQASRDPRLNAVVLKLDTLPGGLGHMDELRDAVIRLRASGKRVIAVLLNAGDSEYLVASAADKIYAVPQAMLDINGFVANVEFLGGTMDWLGVDWDVARVGAFKNAPDQLTRTEMSAEQKEAINAYLDVDVKHFDQALAQTRQLSQEKVRAAWKEGVVTPQRAKELGLIDDIVGSEELNTKLEELVPGARFDPHYAPGDVREARWGDKRKIAIVPIVGDITGGKNGEDPFGLQRVAGAASVVRSLKAAVEDDQVAAIVLRVDSPGGDGLASDLIYREVLEAKKKKPVIASMGDVAASGGYYVAMGAEEIWAEPTTITGSIGVFLVKPAFERLGNKIHLRRDSVERGDMADILGVYRPWTDAEKRAAQNWVNSFYDAFITEVGKSRHLEKDAVDKIAQGRVWAGADAKERGLVDNLGGLLQAIDAARNKAHVPVNEDMEVEIFADRKGLLSALGVGAKVRQWLGDDSATAGLPEGVRTLARELGLADAALTTPGLKAAMPFHLSVQ
jgi:protease-4